MTPEQRAREIICKWAGTDISSQPMENLIQAVAAALSEQIGRLRVERKQMKQTYDAALERANRRVTELEAILGKANLAVSQAIEAARVEGLREAQAMWGASRAIYDKRGFYVKRSKT